MAAPTPTPRPGRALALIAVLVVALYGWVFISGHHSPKLGIDLAGGTSLTLKPVVPAGEKGSITDTAVDQAVNIIRQRVDGLGVAESSVTRQGTGSNSTIVVEVPGVNNKNLANQVGKTAKMSFRDVLLSGAPTVATPTPSATASASTSAKATTSTKPKATASASARATSPTSPTASPSASGNGRPASGLGAASTPTASAAATASASAAGSTPSPSASASSGSTGSSDTPTAADVAAFSALDCAAMIAQNAQPQDVAGNHLVTCSADGTEKFILGKQIIPGSDVTSSSANLNTGGNGTSIPTWEVQLNFNSDGAKIFGDVTRALYANVSTTGTAPDNNRFAVVLDGLVQTAPGVNSAILNGQASITGNFTQSTATSLANVLNYGALPLGFQAEQQQSISATLGSDDLFAGVVAGLIGLALVVVYSLLYYRGLGLVTVASLAVAGTLTYGLLVLLGQTLGYTLSLAGIAGAIVSIGITADSFVVLFERVRDEMRDGRSMRVAVEQGWLRARRTILAADAVSLIAAVTLYLLAVGGVQGFAFTLGLTTIIDVVVVFLFTKPLLTRLARTRFFGEGHRLSGVEPDRLGVQRRPPARRPATAAARRSTPKEA